MVPWPKSLLKGTTMFVICSSCSSSGLISMDPERPRVLWSRADAFSLDAVLVRACKHQDMFDLGGFGHIAINN